MGRGGMAGALYVQAWHCRACPGCTPGRCRRGRSALIALAMRKPARPCFHSPPLLLPAPGRGGVRLRVTGQLCPGAGSRPLRYRCWSHRGRHPLPAAAASAVRTGGHDAAGPAGGDCGCSGGVWRSAGGHHGGLVAGDCVGPPLGCAPPPARDLPGRGQPGPPPGGWVHVWLVEGWACVSSMRAADEAGAAPCHAAASRPAFRPATLEPAGAAVWLLFRLLLGALEVY